MDKRDSLEVTKVEKRPYDWFMTFEDLKKCPTVEGPSLEPTPEEKAEQMKPRPNGGIHFEGCLAVWGGQCSCYR